MASITSRPSSQSPSPYDFNSNSDLDESWQYIDYSSGNSAPSSIAFIPSPASGSLNEWAIVAPPPMPSNMNTPSTTASSPLLIGGMNQGGSYSNVSFQGQSRSPFQGQSPAGVSDMFTTTSDGGFQGSTFLPQQQQQFASFSPQDLSNFSPQPNFSPQANFSPQPNFSPQSTFSPQQLTESPSLGSMDGNMGMMGADASIDLGLMDPFNTEMLLLNPDRPLLDFNLPQPMMSDPSGTPWDPSNISVTDDSIFISNNDIASSPQSMYLQSSGTSSAKAGPSSKSPVRIRKVKNAKVEKKKVEQAGKFVIMTPTTITAHAGRPNPFECFEAARVSARGRKGPLAKATKDSALLVRRHGACFCCASRKVKCDSDRPCKSCRKLMISVPQIVCWKFEDFIPVLYPKFMRGHFEKEQMAKFMRENIQDFTVDGAEQIYTVELYSGSRFSSVLTIQAKVFTPKTLDVVQHWHAQAKEHRVDLHSNGSAPLGIEIDSGAQRENMRKRAKSYIQNLTQEPGFVDQVTESFKSTVLPNKILQIVKRYAQQSDSLIVKRSLSIYSMYYIMSRHLLLTPSSLDALRGRGVVSQNDQWVTPRVLARQLKAVIDDLMAKETQALFKLFSSSLKPKTRREWAPCMAAFLVFCLIMEATESSANMFMVSQNMINTKNNNRPEYEDSFVSKTIKEVENLPFKQFAYQFHQVYQTHSKDANARSFNPFFDTSFAEQGELDLPAMEMVNGLTELFYGESWQELQFLTYDGLILDDQNHPDFRKPDLRNSTLLFPGRLVATFLMSFNDEKVIFGNTK